MTFIKPLETKKSEVKEMIAISTKSESEFAPNSTLDKSRNSELNINITDESTENSIKGCLKFLRKRWPWQRTGKEKTRIYHFWPGKNVFFFGGRLICGPDPRGFILTVVSIVLSSWIFCIYIGDNLTKHSGLVVFIAVVLTVLVLVNLIMVSGTDPGIIPRNNRITLGGIGSNGVKSKRLAINGVEVKLKYCQICKIFRPPRSCHCAICDNCVDKFDHHCPWIGQCIGLRNYRFYLMFLSSGLIFFIHLFSFSCQRINQKMMETGKGMFRILGNCPETVALASFSFVAIWFLGCLTSFHAYLIMLNQTAYENYRQCYVNSPNPYNKGVLRNIKEVLVAKFPPPRVDFQAEMA